MAFVFDKENKAELVAKKTTFFEIIIS